MNERIKELAEQSGKTYAESFRWEYLQDIDKDILGKFAELIVRECAELCLKHSEYEGLFNQMEFRKGQHFNTIIKNHFGVEE